MSPVLVLVAPSDRVGWTEAVSHRVIRRIHGQGHTVGVLAVDRTGVPGPALRAGLAGAAGVVVATADPVATRVLTDGLATLDGEPLDGSVVLPVLGGPATCVPPQGPAPRALPQADRLQTLLRDLGAAHVLPAVVVGAGSRGHPVARLDLSLAAFADMAGAREGRKGSTSPFPGA